MDELKRDLEEAALEHAKDVFGAQGEEVAGIIGQALGLDLHSKSKDADDGDDKAQDDSSDSNDDDSDDKGDDEEK